MQRNAPIWGIGKHLSSRPTGPVNLIPIQCNCEWCLNRDRTLGRTILVHNTRVSGRDFLYSLQVIFSLYSWRNWLTRTADLIRGRSTAVLFKFHIGIHIQHYKFTVVMLSLSSINCTCKYTWSSFVLIHTYYFTVKPEYSSKYLLKVLIKSILLNYRCMFLPVEPQTFYDDRWMTSLTTHIALNDKNIVQTNNHNLINNRLTDFTCVTGLWITDIDRFLFPFPSDLSWNSIIICLFAHCPLKAPSRNVKSVLKLFISQTQVHKYRYQG